MNVEIVTAVIAIITVFITIGKIIYDLSHTLTKLNLSVESLNSTISNLLRDNETEHQELYGGIEELFQIVGGIKEKVEKADNNK